ncbi:MAG: glycosyl transferase, partial [Mameliella sp.]|nr:glycosyl transferase [Mameliella sp.]
RDTRKVLWHMARDPNAQISVISGAWAVPLFQSGGDFAEIRAEAARLQRIEAKMLDQLRQPDVKARIRTWTMADFIEAPMEPLQTLIDEIGQKNNRRLAEAPRLVELNGFGQFLQDLKNQGMHPYLMGDFPVDPLPRAHPGKARKPYLVRK